ncbi:hypothetical protein GCM10020227_56030 [Streptomyces flavovirens]
MFRAQQWSAHWMRAPASTTVLTGGPVRELATGYSKTYTAKDMALVKARSGRPHPGREGALAAHGMLDYGGGVDAPHRAAGTNTPGCTCPRPTAPPERRRGVLGEAADEAGHRGFRLRVRARRAAASRSGGLYTETYNAGVLGPR